MGSLSVELAVTKDLAVGAVPFVVGILMVAGLIAAVVLGRRRRLREPAPPKAPQPRAGAWHSRQEYGGETSDDHGPGHEQATREPEEVPRGPQGQPPPQAA